MSLAQILRSTVDTAPATASWDGVSVMAQVRHLSVEIGDSMRLAFGLPRPAGFTSGLLRLRAIASGHV